MTKDVQIVVVGGGITGVTAALRAALHPSRPQVTLIEADDRLGGKIRTTPFAGRAAVDEGADAFLRRVPWALQLADDVGLGADLVAPTGAPAAVWWDRLHPLPAGLLLGVPTDLRRLATTRLLTLRGKARAATEVIRRRTPTDPDSLGDFVRSRFGDEVHERLVDPLVGSIYAADTDRFSLAAVPQIATVAQRSRSVLLDARRNRSSEAGSGTDSPIFASPALGMQSLVDHAATAAHAAGVRIVTGRSAQQLAGGRGVWLVDEFPADAVILATPRPVAGALLEGVERALVDPAGIAWLRASLASDVALVTLAVPADQWPAQWRHRSGFLVPRPRQRLVTAVSFASQKWQHLAGDDQLLRVSLGREGLPVMHLDDDALISAVLDDLDALCGVRLQPSAVRISRWLDAFPSYRPGHLGEVAELERRLPPGVFVAGAGYHGIGIPACVRSADAAAEAAMAFAAG